jgi:hypothetical protein
MTIKDSKTLHRFAEVFCPFLKESRENFDKELRRRAAAPSARMKHEENLALIADLLPELLRHCAYEHLLLVNEPKNPVNLICAEMVSLNSSEMIARVETALKIGTVNESILREFDAPRTTASPEVCQVRCCLTRSNSSKTSSRKRWQ